MKDKPEITIIDGNLGIGVSRDTAEADSRLRLYLDSWQKEHGIENGTRVRILTQKDYENLVALAHCAGVA